MAVTHLSGLMVNPTSTDIKNGNFFSFPQLTQSEIDSILVNNLTQGTVIYNTDSNVYMCYIDGSWNNLNSSSNYKGEGYSAGSPFAIPSGARSLIEVNLNNQIPGVIYSDTENAGQPRIYINGGWQDVAVAGGGSPTFVNIIVTENAEIGRVIADSKVTTPELFVTEMAQINNLTVTTVTNLASVFSNGIQNTGDISSDTFTGGDITANTIAISGIGAMGGTFNGSPFSDIVNGTGSQGVGQGNDASGSPICGIISITCGGSPIAGGTIATVTLTNSTFYGGEFAVVITPANEAAATASKVYTLITVFSSGATQAQFVINQDAAQVLVPDQVYKWNYIIMGNQQD